METIPLKCACGAVTGEVRDAAGTFRIICHCQGCQDYAAWLGNDHQVDDHGGTDIYQLTPSQLRLHTGQEHVRCVHQTPKGALRWYAGCCRTPIANGLESKGVPWLGLNHLLVDADPTRDDAIGPVKFRIHGAEAKGEPEGVHRSGPISLILRTLHFGLMDTILGKAKPNPFVGEDGAWIVEPERLYSS